MAEPIPLEKRIELAEAFIELVWARRCSIAPGRGFDTQRQADHARAIEMESIDLMLDKLLPMYDARALEARVS